MKKLITLSFVLSLLLFLGLFLGSVNAQSNTSLISTNAQKICDSLQDMSVSELQANRAVVNLCSSLYKRELERQTQNTQYILSEQIKEIDKSLNTSVNELYNAHVELFQRQGSCSTGSEIFNSTFPGEYWITYTGSNTGIQQSVDYYNLFANNYDNEKGPLRSGINKYQSSVEDTIAESYLQMMKLVITLDGGYEFYQSHRYSVFTNDIGYNRVILCERRRYYQEIIKPVIVEIENELYKLYTSIKQQINEEKQKIGKNSNQKNNISSISNLAIQWMYDNELTKFNNFTDFMADKPLRRDEATKFFGQYATTIQKSITDETKTECNNFTDLNEGREDLKNNMQNACKLGLFKGSQGKFMPKGLLTNGQAITVLIRMIDGYKDESKGHFAQKYYERAQQLELLNGVDISPSNFDINITRGDVAILLYNSFGSH